MCNGPHLLFFSSFVLFASVFFFGLFFVCELSKAVKDCVGVYLSIIIFEYLEAFCNKLFLGHF